MKEYVIKWNVGYVVEYDVVEADSEADAMEVAYSYWREEAELNAVYGVVGEATDELKEEYAVY